MPTKTVQSGAPVPLQVMLTRPDACQALHDLALAVRLPRTEVITKLVDLYGADFRSRLSKLEPAAGGRD